MKKVMIVFEVNDEMENGIVEVSVPNTQIKAYLPTRPLPCKRETHVYWKSVGLGNIPTHEISDYDKGWNDCVDMLESEE